MEGEHPVPARYPGAAARSPSTSGHRSVAEGAREAVATSLGALGPWLLGRVGTEWEFLELPRGFYRSCPLHTPMTIPGRWARRGAGVLPCTRSSPSPPPQRLSVPPTRSNPPSEHFKKHLGPFASPDSANTACGRRGRGGSAGRAALPTWDKVERDRVPGCGPP